LCPFSPGTEEPFEEAPVAIKTTGATSSATKNSFFRISLLPFILLVNVFYGVVDVPLPRR
jgi:hypothetical protein